MCVCVCVCVCVYVYLRKSRNPTLRGTKVRRQYQLPFYNHYAHWYNFFLMFNEYLYLVYVKSVIDYAFLETKGWAISLYLTTH